MKPFPPSEEPPTPTLPSGEEAAPGLPPALEARDVHKAYGEVVAIGGVTLRVAPGRCTALVGESGSGKTTLLRTFNAMVLPDEGSVHVGGADVTGLNPVRLRRSVGYVQQEGGLLPHWSVERNVALVPWLLGQADASERARAALDRVGLPASGFAERWPVELSGGQRQRVALARALAAEPGVVLLDEPFGALDAITRAEVRETFQEVRDALRLTALLVTHDLTEAFQLADDVAVMRAGRIEQVAPPEELRTAPATSYVSTLLDRAGVA